MGADGGLCPRFLPGRLDARGLERCEERNRDRADLSLHSRDGWCHANSNNFVVTNSGYQTVSHSESSLQSALYQVGYPISVVVHVGSSFQHYNGGIFSDPSCQYGQMNHAVLAVGYDKSSGSGYWIVKTS